MEKKKRYYYIFIILLFIWSLYETLSWYKNGIIYLADQNIFLYLNVNNYLFYYYAPLHIYTYPGIPNAILFNYFYLFIYLFSRIPLYINQDLLNLFFLFVSSVGFFLLVNKIMNNIISILKKEFNYFYILIIAFITSVFYISNWSIAESPIFLPLYQQFIIYSFLPWIFYLIMRIFENDNMNYTLTLLTALLISIVVIVGNISFLEQTIFIIIIFFLYSIFLVKVTKYRNKKILITKILFISFNVVVLIFYMLNPLYKIVQSTINKSFVSGSLGFYTGNSSINSFYLSLMDLGHGGSSLSFTYPGITIVVGLFLINIAYFIPIEYLILKKNKLLFGNVIFFIITALVFAILYSGINNTSPFSPILKYLFHHYNILIEFRTNAFAVSFYYAFFLAILITIGILFSIFAIKNKKLIVVTLIVIFILVNVVYPFPIISGAHDSNNSNIHIPQYVDNAYNFTENLNGKHNILLVPQSYLWSFTNYYTGVNMLQHVSKDPVITGSPYQDRYNNYTNVLYNDYCNITSIIYNHQYNKSNIQYLHNLFFIMNIKYVYFQDNLINVNETKIYNNSLNFMYSNNIIFNGKHQFGNITIFETNINSSFLLGTNNTDINATLTNNSEMHNSNISNLLTPIDNYKFNKYYDNLYFNNGGFKVILLTFIFSNNFFLDSHKSNSILWFNSFYNFNNNTNLEIKYSNNYINNQRIEFFIGITIFAVEMCISLFFIIIRKFWRT